MPRRHPFDELHTERCLSMIQFMRRQEKELPEHLAAACFYGRNVLQIR
jgi:hypothetical protein